MKSCEITCDPNTLSKFGYWQGADNMIRGGGGGGGARLCFFFVIKLFSTPSLNVQFFQTLSKENSFFLSSRTKNYFFSRFLNFI